MARRCSKALHLNQSQCAIDIPESELAIRIDEDTVDKEKDPGYHEINGLLSINLETWQPHYRSCVQHFLDCSQNLALVKSAMAFINIRLPNQRLRGPIHHYRALQAVGPSGEALASVYFSATPYIRRLVVTGLDTPLVLQIMFGSAWLEGIGHIWKQERLNYLFTAKCSGWGPTKAAYDILPDEHVPFIRPLREPSEDELAASDFDWSDWLAMEDWMVGPRTP